MNPKRDYILVSRYRTRLFKVLESTVIVAIASVRVKLTILFFRDTLCECYNS